ncbi:MAG TPA: hypothetical protein VK766_05690 [Cytophagaceae bacterium]|jgi:hypothetical protein|nr:hypothetical protein [Cytophagaceae bacterium]
MKKLLQDKSFRLAILLTLLFHGTGILFLFLGLAEFSIILFGLLPIVLGISIGALPNRKWAIVGAIIASLFFLYGLLSFGLAGFICIIYSIPIILPLIFLGSVITHLIDRYRKIKTDKFYVLLLPLIPFLIAAPTESVINKNEKLHIDVKTEKIFNYTSEQVYDAIKSVDTLDAEKPFLMNFDLPVPIKCILEKEEVGGIRTCYFDGGNLSRGEYGGGTITERIVELKRGRILRMEVIDYQLVGRNWLGFKEATYYFDKIDNHKCKLTRVTTYTSVLQPRFYWEPLEIEGIEQEHEYVFNNLAKDLKKKYSR